MEGTHGSARKQGTYSSLEESVVKEKGNKEITAVDLAKCMGSKTFFGKTYNRLMVAAQGKGYINNAKARELLDQMGTDELKELHQKGKETLTELGKIHNPENLSDHKATKEERKLEKFNSAVEILISHKEELAKQPGTKEFAEKIQKQNFKELAKTPLFKNFLNDLNKKVDRAKGNNENYKKVLEEESNNRAELKQKGIDYNDGIITNAFDLIDTKPKDEEFSESEQKLLKDALCEHLKLKSNERLDPQSEHYDAHFDIAVDKFTKESSPEETRKGIAKEKDEVIKEIEKSPLVKYTRIDFVLDVLKEKYNLTDKNEVLNLIYQATPEEEKQLKADLTEHINNLSTLNEVRNVRDEIENVNLRAG
jgi:hypothetical protein